MTARGQGNRIFSTILDRICLLDYPPGTMLREGDIAREFDTSRTPVRDALLRLSLMGLVDSRNGVGTFVTGMDYSAYRDLYEIRLKVAEMIGELSPHDARAEDIAAVRQLLARARTLLRDFDLRLYWSLNHELHFVIGRLIGNSALAELWDRYYYQTARIWYQVAERNAQEAASAFVSELDAVVRAMQENDIKAVAYVQRNCIAAAMRKVLAEVESRDTSNNTRRPVSAGR